MKTNLPHGLKTAVALFFISGSLQVASAQDSTVNPVSSFKPVYHNWYNKDAKQDKIHGVSVDRAYKEILNKKTSKKTVVVAVIDSGTDINHEDLQGKIWVNTKEVAGNNQDDDNNGYVDDIHGWGFLGNAKGENIKYETYEYVRLLRKLAPKYEQVKSAEELPEAQRSEYKTYLIARKNFDEELENHKKEKENLDRFDAVVQEVESILTQHLGKKDFTLAEVKAIKTADERTNKARLWYVAKFNQGFTKKGYLEYKERNEVFLNQHLNLEFNPRTLTGDNPEDINDRYYGNNDVTGPRADHGTPVAGIIAGKRGNNIGIDGIAEDVQIMVLRAVPQGDERDKDIALAIRYAVDNGANIINMSFGKDFSPEKSFVDEAVKYAAEHNVLLVHASGNDGQNIDDADNFPTKQLLDGTRANNWLEVGATSMKANKNFTAEFSNYGRKNVDLFAPGVDIVGLAPDNSYDQMDGTSFASPVVSGVAALVWSYYPELTASELKDVLLNSSVKYPKLKVYAPNSELPTKTKVKFSELSSSGGVVNAYEALKLAEKVVQGKQPKS